MEIVENMIRGEYAWGKEMSRKAPLLQMEVDNHQPPWLDYYIGLLESEGYTFWSSWLRAIQKPAIHRPPSSVGGIQRAAEIYRSVRPAIYNQRNKIETPPGVDPEDWILQQFLAAEVKLAFAVISPERVLTASQQEIEKFKNWEREFFVQSAVFRSGGGGN